MCLNIVRIKFSPITPRWNLSTFLRDGTAQTARRESKQTNKQMTEKCRNTKNPERVWWCVQCVRVRVAGPVQHAPPPGGPPLPHLGLPLPHLRAGLQDQADLHQPPGHLRLEIGRDSPLEQWWWDKKVELCRRKIYVERIIYVSWCTWCVFLFRIFDNFILYLGSHYRILDDEIFKQCLNQYQEFLPFNIVLFWKERL